MKKMLAAALMAIILAVTLSACGKVSEPKPYEGSGYPHNYPRH